MTYVTNLSFIRVFISVVDVSVGALNHLTSFEPKLSFLQYCHGNSSPVQIELYGYRNDYYLPTMCVYSMYNIFIWIFNFGVQQKQIIHIKVLILQ